jgi:hypothetical protein
MSSNCPDPFLFFLFLNFIVFNFVVSAYMYSHCFFLIGYLFDTVSRSSGAVYRFVQIGFGFRLFIVSGPFRLFFGKIISCRS